MDINEEIMKEFDWYDYTEFFKLMSVWLSRSANKHTTVGNKLCSKSVGKKMKTMSLLLDRMAKNNYSGDARYEQGKVSMKMDFVKINQKNCKIYDMDWESMKKHAGNSTAVFAYSPDKETYDRQSGWSSKHDKMQYEQDKALFLSMFKKHIEKMWD